MTDFRQLKPILASLLFTLSLSPLLRAQQIPLQSLVTPSTIISKDGHPVTFALHGFIEFRSLSELFPYIESQTTRWKDLDQTARTELARELLRRGIESRVISMTDERPLETLLTHTAQELRLALAQVKEPVPPGYADAFIAVQKNGNIRSTAGAPHPIFRRGCFPTGTRSRKVSNFTARPTIPPSISGRR
jgi:hypothetical protein